MPKQLHKEKKRYPKEAAVLEIEKRIADPTTYPVPTLTDSGDKERKRKVTEFINSNAPKDDDDDLEHGTILSVSGKHAYERMAKRRKLTKDHEKMVKTIEKVKPDIFKNQPEIFTDDESPWSQIFALTESNPKSFDYNFGGTKVTLDSIDYKSHEERQKTYTTSDMNLAQVFIGQSSGENSYWKMSDTTTTTFTGEDDHRMLRSLELQREHEWAFNTTLKDSLNDANVMNNEETFGDMNSFTTAEYKGATSEKRSKNMRRMQRRASKKTLDKAQSKPNLKLGKKVNDRPRTTPKQVQESLTAFIDERTQENYSELTRHTFRVIRGQTGADIDSESSDDSDYGEDIDEIGTITPRKKLKAKRKTK